MIYLDKKGQSILEYTLMLGVVIAVIAWVMIGTDNPISLGGRNGRIAGAYNAVGNSLVNATTNLEEQVFDGN